MRPADAPGPRIENGKCLELIPIPIRGLVPQPALEDPDADRVCSALAAAALAR